MGIISQLVCFWCQRDKHMVIISLMFLLLSSLTLERFMAEGRFITKDLDASNQVSTDRREVEEGVKVVVAIRAQMIGSRPPRCDRKCSSCGHCEAVQVPVTTQGQQGQRSSSSSTRRRRSHLIFSSIAYSRGDDVTNYKPMSWKCKCGNLFFNP